jgi:hypothetical protein
MRIIDKDVTGSEIGDLASDFFAKVCPINKSNKRYNSNYFAGKLQRLADDSKKKGKFNPVYKYLFDNLELLITGTPDELKTFDDNFKAHLGSLGKLNLLNNIFLKRRLRKLFHHAYFSFRNGGLEDYRIEWFENLKLNTCPYCNRHWASKVSNKENTGYRLYFDIDHYWPKGKFPWFAISFYNLIPACTICNQRVKHKDELNIDNHIHPYRDDMHKYLKFNIPIKSSEDFFDDTVDISLEVIPRAPYTTTDDMYIKSKSTYDFFNLENFYNTHLDYVRELMQRDLVYSKDYVEGLLAYKTANGDPIFNDENDLIKMLAGNYVLPEHIHKRPLAKLTQDILEDFTNRFDKM